MARVGSSCSAGPSSSGVGGSVARGSSGIRYLASGDIAGELGLSDGTVRNYLSEAISKLGASNRVEAARIARTKGWL